jgi:uncharacterized protein
MTMDSLSSPTESRAGIAHLDLTAGPLLGRVTRLDSDHVGVSVSDPDLIARVTIADLVAFEAGKEFLIGLVDSVEQRSARTPAAPDADSSEADGALVDVQVMPVGTLVPGEEAGRDTFRRGVTSSPHVGGSCHLLDEQRLHRFMSVLAEGVPPEERLNLGRYMADHDAVAIADGNRLFQRHLALLGNTGSGKSWAVALLVERASRLSHANLIVFDLHREYGPLTRSENGTAPMARSLRVAGPADLGRPSDDVLYLPYWLFERDELMTLVLNHDDPHASDQVFRFTEHMQTLKEISLADAGRHDALATFTSDSPIPYRIDHLVQMLKKDDTEKIVRHPTNRVDPGPYTGRLTGLISRLEARAADPRYGFVFNPPADTLAYEWLTDTATKLLGAGSGQRGIKVVDLSEVPSAIVPIVAGILARLVFELQFWMEPKHRTPVSLVCDEAHLYLPAREDATLVQEVALRAFESIAKEGRKYGVGLILVSQRPTDVSRTILSQCSNFVVMRITNDYDRSMIERLIPERLSAITGVLPGLDVGEAVIIGDALLLPTRVKLDPPTVAPDSATQPYWTLWAHQASNRAAITAGGEALRNQFRATD